MVLPLSGMCTGILTAFMKASVLVSGTSRVSYLKDNLLAGAGRLPDAAMRRRMVEYLERL